MQGTIFAPGTVAALTGRNRLCPANAPDAQLVIAALSARVSMLFSFCVPPEDVRPACLTLLDDSGGPLGIRVCTPRGNQEN